jgi:hypothetical protein
MLLVLASTVFFGSESCGTRDHILLSQFSDFHFLCLRRLAGSRWKYSTPPPHGLSKWIHEWTLFYNSGRTEDRSLPPTFRPLYSLFIRWFETCVNLGATLWFLPAYSMLRNVVVASRCLAMDYSVRILSLRTPVYTYLSMVLQPFVGPWPLFIHTVGRTPWSGDQPVARLLPIQRINSHRHPCLEWDSNPKPQCSSGRRLFMP